MRHPVAVSMFYISISILGVISFLNLSVEGQPETELPQLVVTTSWFGTSPEVVQVFLTSPIEEAAAQLEGLREMESSSILGYSSVTLKFNRDTDMEFARLDLNERISVLRNNLPPGTSQPQIQMRESRRRSRTTFMECSISGPYDNQRLSELIKEQLMPEMSSVEGVADIEIFGDRERNIFISLNREQMDLYGLVPDTVAGKVNEMTRQYETARSYYQNSEYAIAIENSIKSVTELERLIVGKGVNGRIVRLADVARVTFGQAEPRNYSRLNGNTTLRLIVSKETNANVIETSGNLKKTTERALNNLPPGVRIDWITDQGQMMKEQLESVYHRALWCVLLIILLLLLFLRSVSAAVVITLNILFSVMITINFMYYFQVSFNVVTLSGLAIGFGMLVDNAIVVLENIFRHREQGMGKWDAAVLGVGEVGWALMAATLTTVAAFMCMLMLQDRLAATYLPLALAVIFSLSASLLVSFTFTPLLSLLIRGSNLQVQADRKKTLFERVVVWPLEMLQRGYEGAVRWSLHHKLLVLVVAGLFLFMFDRIYETEIDRGGFSFGFMRDDEVRVFLRMPEGTELETADEVIRQFEKPLLEVEGYKDVSVIVRTEWSELAVSFTPEMLASPYPLALKSRLIGIAQGFSGLNVSVAGINADDNFYSGSTGFETYNSSIRLLGYNYKKLMDYSEDILRKVKRNRRVRETNIQTSRIRWGSRDQTESTLIVDRAALKQYNISVTYLMAFVQRNLKLESTARTKFRGEDVRLELKFEDAEDFDIKDLESLVIPTAEGQRIRIVDLVRFEERKVPGGIDRKDQQFAITVQWDYKASYKKARKYNEKIYDELILPPGFKAELDFERVLSKEETENLEMVIYFAVLVVFLIIAALYESLIDPLVIFATVPLAGTGVWWIYWYTGNSFDSTSYIGLIILAGIVVNNSILLVSQLNLEVRRMDETGLTFTEAIVRGAGDRLRPILLTAITTVVGLLPLLDEFVSWFFDLPPVGGFLNLIGRPDLIATNLENAGLQVTLDMFASLSRSTVGGLLSATLSTLLVIPVVYACCFRAKQWLSRRINEIFHVVEGPEGKPE
nr:efflux RND transporter permease subunit [Acanthopleuribacter pedis]